MTPREREVALLVERDFSNYESSLSGGQEGDMTSKRAGDLCRWIAYHEAGHAAVARKLGVWIADIEMTPSHDRTASVQTRSALWVAKQAGGDQAALARGLYLIKRPRPSSSVESRRATPSAELCCVA
jgi:hypothetical protein